MLPPRALLLRRLREPPPSRRMLRRLRRRRRSSGLRRVRRLSLSREKALRVCYSLYPAPTRFVEERRKEKKDGLLPFACFLPALVDCVVQASYTAEGRAGPAQGRLRTASTWCVSERWPFFVRFRVSTLPVLAHGQHYVPRTVVSTPSCPRSTRPRPRRLALPPHHPAAPVLLSGSPFLLFLLPPSHVPPVPILEVCHPDPKPFRCRLDVVAVEAARRDVATGR